MSCGVGHRHSSDSELLWLWCRPAATALIQPLAWEPPYAAEAAQEMAKRQQQQKSWFIFSSQKVMVSTRPYILAITLQEIKLQWGGNDQLLKTFWFFFFFSGNVTQAKKCRTSEGQSLSGQTIPSVGGFDATLSSKNAVPKAGACDRFRDQHPQNYLHYSAKIPLVLFTAVTLALMWQRQWWAKGQWMNPAPTLFTTTYIRKKERKKERKNKKDQFHSRMSLTNPEKSIPWTKSQPLSLFEHSMWWRGKQT